jgi:BTB/POZ domain
VFRWGSDFVTILVGEDTTRFAVHKDLICFYSEHFKAAFNSSFVEGVEQIIKFPDDSPGAIRLFVTWLYTRHLAVEGSLQNPQSAQPYIELYVFADKICCTPLRKRTYEVLESNLVISSLNEYNISHAYERTRTCSPLRAVICKRIAAWISTRRKKDNLLQDWFEPLFEEYPVFAVDLMHFLSAIPPSLDYDMGRHREHRGSWNIRRDVHNPKSTKTLSTERNEGYVRVKVEKGVWKKRLDDE